MIGAERPRLVLTQWFRPGSPRLVNYSKAGGDRQKAPRSLQALSARTSSTATTQVPTQSRLPIAAAALLQAAHHTRPAEHGRRGRGSCHSLERCACAICAPDPVLARHAAARGPGASARPRSVCQTAPCHCVYVWPVSCAAARTSLLALNDNVSMRDQCCSRLSVRVGSARAPPPAP